MPTKTDHSSSCLQFPLLPVKDIVLFPHMIIPVFVNEKSCIKAVKDSIKTFDNRIVLSAFTVKDATGPGLECSWQAPFDVYDIGTMCVIIRNRDLSDGRTKILVQGLNKVKISALNTSGKYPVVNISGLLAPTKGDDVVTVHSPEEVEATIRAVHDSLQKVVAAGKFMSPDIIMIFEDVKDPGKLADLIASNLSLEIIEAQRILAIHDPLSRLITVHSILVRELEMYEMQVKIQSQAKEEIGKLQREHYLREQIQALKSELGDGDPRDEIDNFWQQLEKLKLSDDSRQEVARHIKRLERLPQDSSEASLIRSYVEVVINLPWQVYDEESLDFKQLKITLDNEHYGLDKVKDRILEYLAIKRLNPQAKSPILCFVGPPGVGKTSLGQAISQAMRRKFVRISLGGVRDEAELRGHRKTYIGAYPGRIIQSFRKVNVSNPIIMLDEIDKLGDSYRGDPGAALLEILDPEQNNQFVDHYLGIAFDLSKTMFIANANTLDTIPYALRDRLEVINIYGYYEDEKVEICKRFLLPKIINSSGLCCEDIQLTPKAISCLVQDYTKESGLRMLGKQVSAICRKIARNLAEDINGNKSKKIVITPTKLVSYLGKKPFKSSYYNSEATVGLAFGMAYTGIGGEILPIETTLLSNSKRKNKDTVLVTGQIGKVMQESAQTAYSFITANRKLFHIEDMKFDNYTIHLHVPQGGIPKDGPSAGIAIVTAMISALLNKRSYHGVCLTGEITLLGKVLPVGGIREKLLAAQREQIKTVILPTDNKDDVLKLPSKMLKSYKINFVSSYDQVFKLLFHNVKP